MDHSTKVEISGLLWQVAFAESLPSYRLACKTLAHVEVLSIAGAFADLAVEQSRARCIAEYGFDPGVFNPALPLALVEIGEDARKPPGRGRRKDPTLNKRKSDTVAQYLRLKNKRPYPTDAEIAIELNISESTLQKYLKWHRENPIEFVAN